jgi:predicted nucleic acid-binding protein
MKEKLFIDTWGWVVLHNKREPRHTEVDRFYRKWRLRSGPIYTSDYIFDETFTLLSRRLATGLLDDILVSLDEAIHQGYLILEWIFPERFSKAKELRFRFIDKPMISFTDLTSMVVMKELGIKSILTDDDHSSRSGWDSKKFLN